MTEIFDCSLLKMDQLIHSCHLRIGTGRFQCLRINIISLNICIYIQVHTVLRFLQCIIPAFARNQMFPVFRKEKNVSCQEPYLPQSFASIGKYHFRRMDPQECGLYSMASA